MSHKIYGVTRNGIKEECKWDAAYNGMRPCPRHYLHVNDEKVRVSDHVVWENEDDTANTDVNDYLEAPTYKEEEAYLSWQGMSKIPHAEELYHAGLNSGTIEVRHSGKQYQVKTVRTIDIDGDVNENLIKLAAVSSDMHDADMTNGNEAVGGGMGHYDYATVTRITGWVDMTPEQIEAWKTIQYNNKQVAKLEREVKRLEKMGTKIKKQIRDL